jgi:hypothetical protein
MEQNKDQKKFPQQPPKKQDEPNRVNSPRPEIELPLKGGRPETEWSQQGRQDQKNDEQRTTR